MFRPIRMIAGSIGLLATVGLLVFAVPRSLADPAPAAPPAASTPAPAAPAGKAPPAPAAPAPPVPAPKSAPYPDVPTTHPAAPAVQSLKNKKIMGGKPDGKFHGPDYVTRYELAVILDRFVTYNENEHKPIKQTMVPGPFKLSAPSGHWAYAAQLHLAENAFLPTDSPLFKAPGGAKVTTAEFTDAIAQIEIRLSDRSLPPPADDAPVAPPRPSAPTN